MKKVGFTKMVASGNDFVVMENFGAHLAKKICDRKFGIGADGLLVLEKSKVADVRMRIINSDGSEAEMCGNGARCAALFVSSKLRTQNSELKIETKAGIILAHVKGDVAKVRLTAPKDLKLDILIKVNNRALKVNFINTGVPHVVVFCNGLERIDVFDLGRAIRFHKQFAPAGTNVNFVEISGADSIKIRTYERGVEDETLACGTGSTASALIASLKMGASDARPIFVHTKSKEVLKIYFKKDNKKFQDVWLEGKAGIVYEGEYYV